MQLGFFSPKSGSRSMEKTPEGGREGSATSARDSTQISAPPSLHLEGQGGSGGQQGQVSPQSVLLALEMGTLLAPAGSSWRIGAEGVNLSPSSPTRGRIPLPIPESLEEP